MTPVRSVWRHCCAALLMLFPRSFRDAYRDEMLADLDQRFADEVANRARDIPAMLAREIVDLTTCAFRLRIEQSRKEPAMTPRRMIVGLSLLTSLWFLAVRADRASLNLGPPMGVLLILGAFAAGALLLARALHAPTSRIAAAYAGAALSVAVLAIVVAPPLDNFIARQIVLRDSHGVAAALGLELVSVPDPSDMASVAESGPRGLVHSFALFQAKNGAWRGLIDRSDDLHRPDWALVYLLWTALATVAAYMHGRRRMTRLEGPPQARVG